MVFDEMIGTTEMTVKTKMHPHVSGAATQVPVLVVGAGPGGLTAAIALARQGVESLVVERRTTPSTLPRATAASSRTMELLHGWGLEDAVRAGGVDVDWQLFVCETLARARPPVPRFRLASRRRNRARSSARLRPRAFPRITSSRSCSRTSPSSRWRASSSGPSSSASTTDRTTSRSCFVTSPAARRGSCARGTSSRPTVRAARCADQSVSTCSGPMICVES